ncbi:uncharacterized protein METZ01_LOCUS359677, partial [marine metagenome]
MSDEFIAKIPKSALQWFYSSRSMSAVRIPDGTNKLGPPL